MDERSLNNQSLNNPSLNNQSLNNSSPFAPKQEQVSAVYQKHLVKPDELTTEYVYNTTAKVFVCAYTFVDSLFAKIVYTTENNAVTFPSFVMEYEIGHTEFVNMVTDTVRKLFVDELSTFPSYDGHITDEDTNTVYAFVQIEPTAKHESWLILDEILNIGSIYGQPIEPQIIKIFETLSYEDKDFPRTMYSVASQNPLTLQNEPTRINHNFCGYNYLFVRPFGITEKRQRFSVWIPDATVSMYILSGELQNISTDNLMFKGNTERAVASSLIYFVENGTKFWCVKSFNRYNIYA